MSRAEIVSLSLGTRLTLRAGCCLILDGEQRLLVDPAALGGAQPADEAIRAACGLGLKDVTGVFYTHLHFDHYGADDPLAVETVYMPRVEVAYTRALMAHRHDEAAYRAFLEDSHEFVAPVFLRQFLRLREDPRYDLDRPELRGRLRLVDAGERITPHLTTVALEGHCPGQLGLAGPTRWGETVVAGDAVLSLEDFQGRERLLIVHDRQRLEQSKRRVAGADCVIPSHGAWFNPRRGQLIATEKDV